MIEKISNNCLWYPFTQMKDWEKEGGPIIERGRGNYLIDVNGKKYLDGYSSLWVNLHGHHRKEIDTAIKNQLNKIAHTTLLGSSNDTTLRLAIELIKITPKSLNRVFFSDSGAASVEVALKMAYQYCQQSNSSIVRKRNKFITLKEAYHGDTIGSVSLGGMELFHKTYSGLVFETYKAPAPYCYRCELKKEYPACGLACAAALEWMLSKKAKEISAVVIEPIVQGAAGMIVSPPGYLKRIEQACRKHGVFLICDEVATGFGHTGKMFAVEHEKIQPDIMCIGKGTTGGYLPLSATLTSEQVFKGFWADYKEQKTFFHGHSYSGNPLACAAGLASLEIFRKEKLISSIQPKIRQFSRGLKKFGELPHVGDVRQKGIMIGIELVKNKQTKEPYDWKDKMGIRVILEARKHGVMIRPLGQVIVLLPPLSITAREINKLLSVTYRSIQTVTGK
jgi:adenosylmethionine-8-amino-7-oxononanoate aminotransferase